MIPSKNHGKLKLHDTLHEVNDLLEFTIHKYYKNINEEEKLNKAMLKQSLS